MGQDTEALEAELTPEILELADLLERASEGDIIAERGICFKAASGSIAYQRAIFDAIMEEGRLTTEALVRGEVIARLIASHGIEHDQLVFASLCRALAERFRGLGNQQDSDYYAAEAAVALIFASDHGSGTATDALAALTAEFPAAKYEADRVGKAVPALDPTIPDHSPPPVVRTVTQLKAPSRLVSYFSGLWFAIRVLGRALIGGL